MLPGPYLRSAPGCLVRRPPRTVPCLALAAALATSLGASGAGELGSSPPSVTIGKAPPVSFARKIRPLLADRCFKCHGPDEAARKASLRLDSFEAATAARVDGAALSPGSPEKSLLWQRLTQADPQERMPPADGLVDPLTAEELETVRRWIEEGASYEPHWSFRPPSRPPVPVTRAQGWPRNAVDAFTLRAMEDSGLEPSPPGEPAMLLRRLLLDLTGLPPEPGELQRFEVDVRASSPDEALDRWTEILFSDETLRSRYAEHMTARWLDLARYADTSGIHTDAGRSIWPWRDWVLRAFQGGMPFDQFLVEQLAGDLLPEATLEQRVATGFHRNHVTTDEGGAIDAEYLVEYAADRVNTTGSVLLGLTLACARCHDHKFDPVSQTDYYRLFAFFNNNDEPGLYSQLPDPKRAFEPFLEVPSPEQQAQRQRLQAELQAARRDLSQPIPGERADFEAFRAAIARETGVEWVDTAVVSARAEGGAALALQGDGSLLASGPNPAQDVFEVELQTDGQALDLMLLEALRDPSLFEGRVGRAPNGNAVLTAVKAFARAAGEPAPGRAVELEWCWADVEQPNGDFRAVNALVAGEAGGEDLGWAVDAHRQAGDRALLLLAREPFGFAGGTRLLVRLEFRSVYEQHALGRVRLGLGRLGAEGRSHLPVAESGWYLVGPFPAQDGDQAFAGAFGPESDATLDLARNFGSGNQRWRFNAEFVDGQLNRLANGTNTSFVSRRLLVPTARKLHWSLGSDDGLKVLVDGREVFARRVDRQLAADQDQLELELPAGRHVVTLHIANSGGDAGFYFQPRLVEGQADALGALDGALAAALLPERALTAERARALEDAWRLRHSPRYRQLSAQIAALEQRLADLANRIPKTMVMRERGELRPTFVLERGQYDRPLKDRPVERALPELFGAWPEGAPRDRLGLARWLVSKQNPLVARVAVNRLWEQVFGTGLVRTSEDFGLQGEFPSHPELLDWLAVEFVDSGWSVEHVLRLLVQSSTYRQSSRWREDARARDPENRLLASFPRRRLSAEQIRDLALYASGLLVENLGGPSVKPYQPEGLWEEVSMPASNTRSFELGADSDLWRRSLYTYWKRASPPPAMLAFDAPTRESCTVRRPSTNTPLQALALWNDVQMVEAARVLAQHALRIPGADQQKLAWIFLRCTAREPKADEASALEQSLARFRERYRSAPAAAIALLAVGKAPLDPALETAELAAWTLVASAVLACDATLAVN
jgi:hypothetical protein